MCKPKAIKKLKLFAVRHALEAIVRGESLELITDHSTYLFYFHESYISVTLEANWNYSEYENLFGVDLDNYLKYEVEPYI